MSRIGKQPVQFPGDVNVDLKGGTIKVKGPKGELGWDFPAGMDVQVQGQSVLVQRPDDTKQSRALHGLTRSLINNMVTGVSKGYERALEINGVGYRAQVQGKKITFALGFSHPVEFELPDGIAAEVDKKQTSLKLSGIDKQKIGQVAADIRSLRPPDSYKGKGIRYAGERIKLKAGKAGK